MSGNASTPVIEKKPATPTNNTVQAVAQPTINTQNTVTPNTATQTAIDFSSDSSQQKLQTIWNDFFTQLEQNDARKAGIFSLIKYSANSSVITFKLSETHESFFKSEIQKDLIKAISTAFQSSAFTTKIDIEASAEANNTKPYKPSDKYNFLLSKNEKLDSLTKKFNLEIKS